MTDRGAEHAALVRHVLQAWVGRGRAGAYAALTEGLAHSASPAESVAQVQYAVEQAWLAGEIDEYAVSAVAAVCVDLLDAASVTTQVAVPDSPASSPGSPAARRPRIGGADILVVCPPREWHDLPARLLAASLRERGVSAQVVGPAAPLGELARVIAKNPHALIAVSCTTVWALVDLAAVAAVAHNFGHQAIAGGSAVVDAPGLARALGADGYAADVDALLAALVVDHSESGHTDLADSGCATAPTHDDEARARWWGRRLDAELRGHAAIAHGAGFEAMADVVCGEAQGAGQVVLIDEFCTWAEATLRTSQVLSLDPPRGDGSAS